LDSDDEKMKTSGNYLYLKEIAYWDANDEDLKTLEHDYTEPAEFTGKIRLARSIIKDLSIYADLKYPFAFKTVLDITFKDGRIVEMKDRSQELRRLRSTINKHDESRKIVHPIDGTFASLKW